MSTNFNAFNIKHYSNFENSFNIMQLNIQNSGNFEDYNGKRFEKVFKFTFVC